MSEASFLPTTSPEEVELSSARLQQAVAVLEAEVEGGRIPGAVFGIARHGKLACLEAVGFRDKEARDPMSADAIFPLSRGVAEAVRDFRQVLAAGSAAQHR